MVANILLEHVWFVFLIGFVWLWLQTSWTSSWSLWSLALKGSCMQEWRPKIGVGQESKEMKMGYWQCSPFKACQISIKVQLSPNLWCACDRQWCCFEQCMCGWMISLNMMHDTPLTCNHHQSVTYLSAYNPLINVVVDSSKLHWSFYLIISAYLFKIMCSALNHCGQLVLAMNGCQGAK